MLPCIKPAKTRWARCAVRRGQIRELDPGQLNLVLAAGRRVGHIEHYRRCGRVAEGGGLLNRYRVVKPYRGFESLRLRQIISINN
jgi:hypothetical protein